MTFSATGVQSGTDANLSGMSAVTGAVINDPLYVFAGTVDVTGSLTVPVESARFTKITARGTLVVGSDDGNPQSGNIIYLTQNAGSFGGNGQPFSTIAGANVTLRSCTIYFTSIASTGDVFGSFSGQAYTFACKNAKIISVGAGWPWHYIGGGGVINGLYIRRANGVFFTAAPTSVSNFQLVDSPWGAGLDTTTGATIRLSGSSLARSVIQRFNNVIEMLDTQLTEWLVARQQLGTGSAWKFLRTIGVAAIGSQAGSVSMRIMDNANGLLASGTTNASTGILAGQVIQWGQINQNSMVLTPDGSENSPTNKITASAIVNNTGNVHAAGQYKVPLRVQFIKYGATFVTQTVNTIDITNSAVIVPLSLAPNIITDASITQTNAATVAAYTQVSNLDQIYDLGALFKVNNPLLPTWDTTLIISSGTVLSLGTNNLIIDPAAASAFAFNTGTNTITVKSTSFAAGSKFNSASTTGAISVGSGVSVSAGLVGTVTNAGTISGVVTGNVTNTGTLSSGANITGNVTQATPSSVTNVTITGNLTYNTNTPVTVTFTSPSQVVSGTVINSGTGLVTIRLAGGATVGTVGSNVTTQIVTSLNLTGLTAGSQIYVSDGAGAQVAYVASSTTGYILDTTGGTGTWTWKVARYGYTSQSGTFTPATSGATVSVSLIADAFITQASASTVAAYTTLQNPDRIYDYAAYFETTNAGIPLARIAAKQGVNVSLGAYNAVMNASGAVWSVAGNTVTMATTSAFVGGVTMTGGLTTSGDVTLNAQAISAGSYAPISANNIALAGLPNYQTLAAITAITGLPTTGTLSAAGSLGLGAASAVTATGDITFSGTALTGALAVSRGTEVSVTLADCTGSMSLTKGGAGNVKAIVSGVTQRSILPTTLPTGVSLFAACTIARFGGGSFNLVARSGTTGAFTDFGYSAGITSKTLLVAFGEPVELAMWTLGYLTFVRTLTTTGGGFSLLADMVTEPDVDTTLDVSGYLANITVSNAGGVFTVIFNADMSIPGLEQAKAIVHRLLALENSMRALLPPGSATIIDIDADEVQINQPGVFLTLGTGVNSVEIAGYFNTLPAKAINSAYVLNPRRVSDNLRVEIPLVKPAIDAALLARAVRTELTTELGRIDVATSTRSAESSVQLAIALSA